MNKAAFFVSAKKSLCPGGFNRAQVIGLEAILDAWPIYGDGDLRKLAYCLATAWHETGAFKWTHEIWGPTKAQKRYEARADLGNIVNGDGKRFMGRGYCQITGRRNYRYWSKRLGLDLIGNPDLVTVPANAARILVQGSMLGTFTGLRLGQFIIGSMCDYHEARRVINGTDDAELIAGYADKFSAALLAK